MSYFSWADHLNRLSERNFKLRYRVDRASFDHLHERLNSSIGQTCGGSSWSARVTSVSSA